MEKRQERGLASLKGRRALVVGGSGGIGLSVALALAGRGAEILLAGGREAAGMEAALAGIRGLGASCRGVLVELGRPRDLLESLGGDLDFDLVACAFGPFFQAPLHETGLGDWERMTLLNLALPGALASAVLPGMVRRSWGRLVFFGGTGTDTIKGFRTNAAYASAKTGLGVLAKSIALEYADRNVAAFVACPGLVDTPYLTEALRRELAAKSPRGSLIPADDIGESVVALAAADPCLVSGALVSMDGGLGFRK